eukprot:7550-Heterococcus_DN1.PRE.3
MPTAYCCTVAASSLLLLILVFMLALAHHLDCMYKQDYRFVNWGVQGPSNVLQGAREGIGGFAHEVCYKRVRRPIRGGVILVDKLATGGHNMTHGLGLANDKRLISSGVSFKQCGCCHTAAAPLLVLLLVLVLLLEMWKAPRTQHRVVILVCFYVYTCTCTVPWRATARTVTATTTTTTVATNRIDAFKLLGFKISKRYTFYDKFRKAEHKANAKLFGRVDSVTSYNVSSKRSDLSKGKLTVSKQNELQEAFIRAVAARKTFDHLAPNCSTVKNSVVLAHLIEKSYGHKCATEAARRPSVRPSWMTEMIDAMDTSGDGQISFPEFCMFLRALAAADKASTEIGSEDNDIDLGPTRSSKLLRIKQLVGFNSHSGSLFNLNLDVPVESMDDNASTGSSDDLEFLDSVHTAQNSVHATHTSAISDGGHQQHHQQQQHSTATATDGSSSKSDAPAKESNPPTRQFLPFPPDQGRYPYYLSAVQVSARAATELASIANQHANQHKEQQSALTPHHICCAYCP